MKKIKRATIRKLTLFVGVFCFIAACDIPTETQQEDYNLFEQLETVEGAEETIVTINQGSAVGRDAYFEFTIDNIQSELIAPGVYDGWCIEWTKPIAQQGDKHDNLQMYTTYGQEKWKPLNYFLNIKDELEARDPDLNYADYQAVIWTVTEGPEFDINKLSKDELPPRLLKDGEPVFDKAKVNAIVEQVRTKAPAFEYTPDKIVALFLKTDENDQDIMVPSDPEEETVSHGYVEGVTPSDDPRFAERTYPVIQADWEGPGGDKRWLGMNLGATEEPTSSDYKNPEAAGWYFHFNRLQGHYAEDVDAPDSDIIIPGTNDASFSEDSGWIVENDPCQELLGGSWRIPTIEEWRSYHEASIENGAMGSGDQDAAFNSILKLHTTGFVRFFEGANLVSTNAGFYWNTDYQMADSEGLPTPGKVLFFDETGSSIENLGREHAAPLRCIED